MNTVRSISGSSEVFQKADNIATQLGTTFSGVVIMALNRLDEIEFNFLEAKPHEESQVEKVINPTTDHVTMKPEIIELVEAQFNPKIEVKPKTSEKVEFCEGGLHDRGAPLEAEGEIIGLTCKSCNYIMVVNQEKFSGWKNSQSGVAS